VHAPHAPPWQTWFVPQIDPSIAFVPVSLQIGAPVAQEVAPAWQGFVGVQSAPCWQATHDADASHTRPVPHGVPGARAARLSTQTGTPVRQSYTPAWHGFPGGASVQAVPAAHATHAPDALHTWNGPQVVPPPTSAVGTTS
jgi:hypothetical protein